VSLAHDREAPAAQALDQPHLPEGLGAIELLGEDPRGDLAELLFAPGWGKGGVADVVTEVQVRIVDPDRPALAQGDEAHLLPEPRNQWQAGLDVIAKLDVGRGRALEQCGRGDVHVGAVLLQVEERGVQSCESIGHGLIFAYQV
jgi:hypothetical protein